MKLFGNNKTKNLKVFAWAIEVFAWVLGFCFQKFQLRRASPAARLGSEGGDLWGDRMV